MKFTNKQVAEIFSDSNVEASSNNMFIEGDTVYSYGKHFPIAKKIGDNKVEFTTDKYSTTTGKHKSLVLRYLINEGYEIIEKSFKQ